MGTEQSGRKDPVPRGSCSSPCPTGWGTDPAPAGAAPLPAPSEPGPRPSQRLPPHWNELLCRRPPFPLHFIFTPSGVIWWLFQPSGPQVPFSLRFPGTQPWSQQQPLATCASLKCSSCPLTLSTSSEEAPQTAQCILEAPSGLQEVPEVTLPLLPSSLQRSFFPDGPWAAEISQLAPCIAYKR